MTSMDQLDPLRIASALLTAPGWARVGLSVRDQQMREKAAEELVWAIVERPRVDPDQLALPLTR